jgi:hypothetical protein
VDSLISVPFAAPLYGIAEFQSGMGEAEGEAEGYSAMQKGLFFVVILACVALYLRVTAKKANRVPEKSMV